MLNMFLDGKQECWNEKTHPRIATTSFLEILWPSFTLNSLTIPSLWDFIATCIFIDSKTTILSPFFTESPLFIEIDITLPGIWLDTEFWDDWPPIPLRLGDFSRISVSLECFFNVNGSPFIKIFKSVLKQVDLNDLQHSANGKKIYGINSVSYQKEVNLC